MGERRADIAGCINSRSGLHLSDKALHPWQRDNNKLTRSLSAAQLPSPGQDPP
jgi:hypothetical protein